MLAFGCLENLMEAMISVGASRPWEIIFLDFDGVVKDSLAAKGEAFEQIFLPFGADIAKKVRRHHEANGGVSRFDKLPLYFTMAETQCSEELIAEYARKFSDLVMQKVIDSHWVPGVRQFLAKHYADKQFFLITATPQEEIQEIVEAIGINDFFTKIVGTPVKKSDAIHEILEATSVSADRAMMIGDSISDYQGAVANNITFILRKTSLNRGLQQELICPMIDDFFDLTI